MSMTVEELNKHKDEITLSLNKAERAYKAAKTNHILHIILSIVTAGIWIIAWLFIANWNIHKRTNLEKIIDESKSGIIDIENQLRLLNNGGDKKTIECPWCAETILEKAKICKHCGKELN